MLGVVINLEKYMYSRFDLVQELIKEIVFRRAEMSQIEIVRVLEYVIELKQNGGMMLAS